MQNANTPINGNFTDWPKDVPCKGLVDLFFSFDKSESAEATKICNDCHIKKQCNDYASKNKIRHGVWGGVNRNSKAAIAHAAAEIAASQEAVIPVSESPNPAIS